MSVTRKPHLQNTDQLDDGRAAERAYPTVGVQVPRVYLPRPGVDMQRWAVIACDQYTSQPQYWRQVEQLVGDAPSTLNLILPELYLEGPEEEARVCRAQAEMQRYLDEGILAPHTGMVFVERKAGRKTRQGLMLCLDLEQYDYNHGSQSLIRATEGTIVERIPPRMRIRVGAALELPHILVLIDDPGFSVIEPVAQACRENGSGVSQPAVTCLYDFDLMMDSGHLTGYLVNDRGLEAQVIAALERLAEPAAYAEKYGLPSQQPVMLFAMGDGNHSLATAKNTWERIKPMVGIEHPARYALVEIENVHDAGLEFEPIHRVLFGLEADFFASLQRYFGEACRVHSCETCDDMTSAVEASCAENQVFGVVTPEGFAVVEFPHAPTKLAVGTVQPFIDQFMKTGGAEKIDYVHGFDVVCELGSQPGNLGIYLPCMDKSDLFKAVIMDGALPRKTFSMGEAYEKRFYMECRKIVA